jgi:hypothetical protein
VAHRQRSRCDAQGHAQVQAHQILQCHNVVDLLLPICQAGKVVFALQHAQIIPTVSQQHQSNTGPSEAQRRTEPSARRRAGSRQKPRLGGQQRRRVWGCV